MQIIAAIRAFTNGICGTLEQFQQKCEAILRPELRKNKKMERFCNSKKSGNALGPIAPRVPPRTE
ncbi:hypothetical protein Rhsp01_31000 [Rhizobium sp. NBRC 114257]|uniref:Uncharacterized protein n=1 Tax=Rhizobium dioscoreae TaxID=2653122 RepID=A0ABQ0Z497_9HYPH|nr:hypothetical protein RsS93_29290 [Rhizobium dioscoreae]GLU81924.1 hypothetical protein Rhsp01_31000 [Rhizobium sp. NBRC 114257]